MARWRQEYVFGQGGQEQSCPTLQVRTVTRGACTGAPSVGVDVASVACEGVKCVGALLVCSQEAYVYRASCCDHDPQIGGLGSLAGALAPSTALLLLGWA